MRQGRAADQLSGQQWACPGCGTTVGLAHHRGCDVERCSVCGEQRLSCECEGHDPARSYWTGWHPGRSEDRPEKGWFRRVNADRWPAS